MSYKHIAVAVSNTPEDYTLVNRALLVAGQRQTRLTLIHVDNELAELYSGVYGADAAQIISELENSQMEHLQQLVKNTEWPGLQLKVVRGELPGTLLEIIEEEHCDLLICGHHHTFLNRMLPVYRGLVNKVRADLLIVPVDDTAVPVAGDDSADVVQ
ncbi:universal stress protein [Salmonella enterica]|nr:universal stress protein UspD [Salmonella enterica]EBP9840252.1 universal stress protein UspD [Salmonella enterica subsp. enterica]ECA4573065.1 universal stress protein UspD [Salmonella enterica subsp. enterica serovar Muenchen]EJK8279196.1 universal stress protein [Salmonella enterica subsp. enterica serovar Manhattan]EAP7081688.1 universal stress protein UspD [Salmonella enterica]